MAEQVTFGPFEGYTSSVDKFNCPTSKITGDSTDYARDPFTGGLFKRKGMAAVQSSDTSGMLETKWSARARQGLAFVSTSLSDGSASASVLFSNDTNAATFPLGDTGYFGQLAVLNTNGAGEWYNLLKDFTSTHYPTLGGTFNTVHDLKVPPLWYESGAGGYMRGSFAFQRQFLLAGSRRMVDAGDERFFPCLRATPCKYSRTLNNVSGSASAEAVRIFPTGPLPLLYFPTVAAGTAATGSDANWEDGDSFFYMLVPKRKDGSYGAPLQIRSKNANLTNGLGFVTIGTIGGTSKYRDIQWTKISAGYSDTDDIILCRTGKQKLAAATDTLAIDAGTFFPIGLVRAGQTSFTDTIGADAALEENTDVVRLDHVMPKRARYIGTGDNRVLQGHTLPSPHAIILAPTGVNSSRDLNAADDSSVIYGSTQMIYRVTATTIDIGWATGASSGTAGVDFNSIAITLSGKTIQDICDIINATTVSSNSKEWAAQVCPGVDPSMSATQLAPTTYTLLATPTNTSTTLTASTTFADVPLAYRIVGTNITAGTYVASKTDAQHLTMSAAATGSPGAISVIFYADTGDDAIFTAGGHTAQGYGWIRAFGPAYPGFAYLRRSAIVGYDKPDRVGVNFTIGSPGAANSGAAFAPNSWTRYNRRAPSFFAGNLLGFADIQGASVCVYSGGIGMFANIRGVNTGEDFDYKIFTVNSTRGAVSYAIVEGNGWAAYPTSEGVVAVDKQALAGGQEIVLSNDIFNPGAPGGPVGNLVYELKTSAGSARSSAADADGMRIHLGLSGSQLHVMYRSDSGVTAPNRRIVYDFSPGMEASGIAQLADGESRKPYGWSAPFVQAVGPVFPVVRSDDRYLYGVGEANSGTGDGRLDRLDSGNTDNGSTITASAYMATLLAKPLTRVSAQRILARHYDPNGSLSIVLYRDVPRSVGISHTLATASTAVQDEIVNMTQDGKTVTTSVEYKVTDSATTNGNGLWLMLLEYEETERY